MEIQIIIGGLLTISGLILLTVNAIKENHSTIRFSSSVGLIIVGVTILLLKVGTLLFEELELIPATAITSLFIGGILLLYTFMNVKSEFNDWSMYKKTTLFTTSGIFIIVSYGLTFFVFLSSR